MSKIETAINKYNLTTFNLVKNSEKKSSAFQMKFDIDKSYNTGMIAIDPVTYGQI